MYDETEVTFSDPGFIFWYLFSTFYINKIIVIFLKDG